MKHFMKKQGFTNCIRMMALLFALSIELVFGNVLYGQTKTIPMDDVVKVTFEENFVPSSGNPLKLPMLQKEDRLKAKATKIEPTILTDNEQVEKCFNYAISVWENQILNGVPIYIELRDEPIDCDIRTDVYNAINKERIYIPLSLLAYQNHLEDRDHTYPDGIITINTSTNWDYSIGEKIPSDCKNLTFALMRGIANILGFGSSVGIKTDQSYYFKNKKGYNIFDLMISNSQGKLLTSIPIMSEHSNLTLNNYIKSEHSGFHLNLNSEKIELAAPPYSSSNPPLSFLKDENSLMRQGLEIGSYALQVDNLTAKILNFIGWNIAQRADVTIECEELGDSGIASAYIDHLFKVKYTGARPQNPHWELELPLASGTKEIKTLPDKNLTCTVPSIENEDKYLINQDGDIEGTLKFSYTQNGSTYYADAYRIYFELQPYIGDVVIENIEDNAPLESYNVYFKAKYRGAPYLKVSVEEEWSSKLKTTYFYEPFICSGVAKYITAPYYAWLHFIAKNKYGESIHTVKFKPYGVIDDGSVQTSIDTISASRANLYDCIMVYNINGTKVKDCLSMEELESLKGLYVIRCYSQGNLIKTIKYLGR